MYIFHRKNFKYFAFIIVVSVALFLFLVQSSKMRKIASSLSGSEVKSKKRSSEKLWRISRKKILT